MNCGAGTFTMVVFEHIGRSSEVFIRGSLSFCLEHNLFWDIPRCVQEPMFTYTDHHTHSLQPPLVLVHAAHNRVAYCLCSTLVLENTTLLTSFKL